MLMRAGLRATRQRAAVLSTRRCSGGEGGETAGGFRAAQTAFAALETRPPPPPPQQQSFEAMMRKSALVRLGAADGRVVVGRIVQTFDDDLYIDFGGKFECVCKRPRKDSAKYARGVEVVLRLHDLELSDRFLGSLTDLTLLEAAATLIGLHNPSPVVQSPAKKLT